MWDSIPFLTLIYVEESSQGRGFGRIAIDYWEKKIKELNYPIVMTSTKVDEQAQHFYRKLGYIDRGSLFLDRTPLEQPQEIFMIKNL